VEYSPREDQAVCHFIGHKSHVLVAERKMFILFLASIIRIIGVMYEHPWRVSYMAVSNITEITVSAFCGTRVSLLYSHSPATDFIGSNEVWGSQSVTPCSLLDRHQRFRWNRLPACAGWQSKLWGQLSPDDLLFYIEGGSKKLLRNVICQIKGFYYRTLHSSFQYSSRVHFMVN